MEINWGELGKQLTDWGGDYDVFSNASFDGGVRDRAPQNTSKQALMNGSYSYSTQGKNKPVYNSTGRLVTSNNQPVGGGGGGGGGGRGDTGSGTGSGGGGGGYSTGSSSPKLDQSQIDSLLASLGIYDTDRDNAKRQAATKRNTFKREKDEELKRERGKYDSKKQTVAQEYGTARTDSSTNARDTIQTLLSSLSTLGMGGSRELTRQILAAANKSNRQANTTQAQNNQELDSAFNEYKGGYKNDIRKIDDQYGADAALADKSWAEKRRDTLHRVGSVYGQADRAAERDNYMRQGDGLNSIIANSAFMNPSYTGESRAMATPELSDYTQDVAQYDTTAIGGDQANGTNVPGNLAVKAMAINDKDFGIKKKNEADLGYGV